MKIKFLYLNILFAIAYSAVSLIYSNGITPTEIIKVVMMSAAIILVGYILDSKSAKNDNNKK